MEGGSGLGCTDAGSCRDLVASAIAAGAVFLDATRRALWLPRVCYSVAALLQRCRLCNDSEVLSSVTWPYQVRYLLVSHPCSRLT